MLGSQVLTDLRDRIMCTTDSVARIYLPEQVRGGVTRAAGGGGPPSETCMTKAGVRARLACQRWNSALFSCRCPLFPRASTLFAASAAARPWRIFLR